MKNEILSSNEQKLHKILAFSYALTKKLPSEYLELDDFKKLHAAYYRMLHHDFAMNGILKDNLSLDEKHLKYLESDVDFAYEYLSQLHNKYRQLYPEKIN